MKFKLTILTLSVFLVCTLAKAQNDINSYKYVLVQKQYEFQKSEDSYQINSLLVFLFKRAGFNAMFTNDNIPTDLAQNACLAAKAVLKNQPTFLRTKMSIDLIDCQGRTILSTTLATTKEKDYKKAYHEVIRKTFEDIENLNYSYDGNTPKNAQPVENPVKKSIPETQSGQLKKVVVVEDKIENPIKKAEVKKAETTEMIKLVPAKKAPEKEVKEIKKNAEKAVKAEKIAPPKKVKTAHIQSTGNMTISGKFDFGKWGICVISGDESEYAVTGGTENFVFATMYTTSKPNIYILKWTAYKKPELAVLNSSGDLQVDSADGVVIYKRVD